MGIMGVRVQAGGGGVISRGDRRGDDPAGCSLSCHPDPVACTSCTRARERGGWAGGSWWKTRQGPAGAEKYMYPGTQCHPTVRPPRYQSAHGMYASLDGLCGKLAWFVFQAACSTWEVGRLLRPQRIRDMAGQRMVQAVVQRQRETMGRKCQVSHEKIRVLQTQATGTRLPTYSGVSRLDLLYRVWTRLAVLSETQRGLDACLCSRVDASGRFGSHLLGATLLCCFRVR